MEWWVYRDNLMNSLILQGQKISCSPPLLVSLPEDSMCKKMMSTTATMPSFSNSVFLLGSSSLVVLSENRENIILKHSKAPPHLSCSYIHTIKWVNTRKCFEIRPPSLFFGSATWYPVFSELIFPSGFDNGCHYKSEKPAWWKVLSKWHTQKFIF